jgi:DNA-directed RNA polymerase subunit N (RpoN/RPB10)
MYGIPTMSLPVKCFTCGNVLADKYRFYLREVRKRKSDMGGSTTQVQYLTPEFADKTPEGEVLDELGLNKMCCRRHILTHVDIE